MLSDQISNFSFTSKTVTTVKEDIHYEELSNEQLKLSLEEGIRINKTLTYENEVLERFLLRKDPQCLNKMLQILESTLQAQKAVRRGTSNVPSRKFDSMSILSGVSRNPNISSTPSLSSVQLARTVSGSQHLSMGTGGATKRSTAGLKLTLAHRTELVEKEMEEIKKEFESFKKGLSKKIEISEARIKEIKYRILESEQMTTQFQNEILNQVDPIAQREERGELLNSIDFLKLEIENRNLIDENEKNHRILTLLKQRNGYFNLVLKNHKDKLIEKKSLLQNIQNNVKLKKLENVDLSRAQIKMKHELRKKLGQLNNIKKLQEKYEAPEVQDFLDVQRKLQEATKNIKKLNRQRKLQLFKINSSVNKKKNSPN